MYPGVELRLYRYVSVLAEELNFTQAAMRLHVSQPTLSTQIRELEREIDVKLFERTRGGQQVVLTTSGEAFAAEARLALIHADRAIQEARAAHGQHTGTWNLGYSPLIDLRLVSKVRGYLSDVHPAVDVRLVSGHTAEHVEALTRGRLHAGLVILPVVGNRVTFEGLHQERLILALPKEHALTTKKRIEITDLNELPLVKIRGDIEPRFGRSLKLLFSVIRVYPRILHEATTQAEALEVASQDGIAALTTPAAQYTASDRIVFRKFLDEILIAETGLAYFGEPTSPILKSLRNFRFDTFQPLASRPLAADGNAGQMKLF
ncbi:MAG TPA: LysR substrate-binding domain-containing protein [Candidatus Acidoferrum sp.]|jgi:DNA-binding transcriptional LysR family regulator